MRRTAAVIAVVPLLALIACDGGDGSATATTTTEAAPTSATTVPAPGPAAVTLKADGIGDLTFGAAEADVRAALTQALGQPTFDETLPPDSCPTGATRRVAWGDLAVLFNPGEGGLTMAGWTYGTPEPPPDPVVTGPDGIGVGTTTVGQLRAAYGDGVEVSDDEEAGVVRLTIQSGRFQLPLSGVVSGPTDAATVRALYAGSYCGG